MPRDICFAASTYVAQQPQVRQIAIPERLWAPSAHPQITNYCLTDKKRPYKFDVILNSLRPDKKTQELHAWNPDDSSENIYIKEDDVFTFRRQPIFQSTDCIRGKMGYRHGFHVWQITWPQRYRGTNALIGVARKKTELHVDGYTSSLGTNIYSYGWDLVSGLCYHNSTKSNPCAYPSKTAAGKTGKQYKVPDQFYCILDMDEGYLAFAAKGEFLGVAFSNMKGHTLYPIASAVFGNCEITMKYIGGLHNTKHHPGALKTANSVLR